MEASAAIIRLYMRLYVLKHKSVKYQRGVLFNPSCSFEGNNLISSGSSLRNVRMGFGSYVNANCHLGNTSIGRYSCIGPYVRTASGRHPTRDFVSVHPAFYSADHCVGFSYVSENKFNEMHYAIDNGSEKFAVDIGNDVWIGAGVTLLDGVKIGDGAVVGANSLVTKDVEPYTIVAGTPAKTVRTRFSDEDIQFLLQTQWWNLGEETIQQYADSFENIAQFKERFQENV